MSSSSDEPRKRRIKTGKKSVLCSTPLEEACKLSNASPSASTIRTNSTSSIVIRRRLIQRVKAEKKQKPAFAEKERKPAKAKKEQKKKKKKKKKTKEGTNRKKPKKPVDSDDWLTVEEQSDDEKENLKQPPRTLTKGPALFQDTASPERVREAQHFHDYHFDSPIRQRRGDDASPVPVDLGGYEKSLPSENLSHLRIRFDSSDEEEDEKLYFRRSSPVKSYPGARDRRKRKREIRINKSKQWLANLKVPTVAADTLWDDYVREHPEEMREYVAPPAERQEESPSSEDYLISPRRKQNKGDRGKATKKDNIENWWSKEIWFGQDVPRDRFRTRGHFDGTSRKWLRKVIKPDLYRFPEPKDAEFEVSKTGAPRIRLNEYLKKCKARKDLDSQAAGPSCSRNEQTPNETVKNTKIEQKKKLQRRKPVEDDSSSDTETANSAVAGSLATEWQRFSNLRSYATRLKANEREMLSKSVTKSLNEKSLVPAKRIKQERASESSTNDSKRAKIADENNAPVIKSVQKLVEKRYVKEKGHWRIV
ncbi:uncharacterized protein LOC143359515 isoform X2 [Halictus rubicundus]|uniref:uncharacterized protein LOC143359515 isoform X2 n=1 Tax=Halictus rubicundus TaxID=77578 RepID=UPI0040372543